MNEKCGFGECQNDPVYNEPFVVPALPDPEDCGGGGTGGGGGDGHKYTFQSTGTGFIVREDGKIIYTYTDKNENTTYVWQATTDGWLVKDNKGNTVFSYTDKVGKDTTYSFEQTDDCGMKVTDNEGKVVFEYKNTCAGTTYTYEQTGVDFKVTDNRTGQVVFNYKGTVDTNTTYHWENYKDGFKVTDSDGLVAYVYDPTLGDRSDGSYSIDTLLTPVFKGHTTISTGQIVGFDPAKLVVGETLVYDGVGTVGVITKDNGDGTYQVTTMTTSPGSRQGVRLGSVKKEEDLPKTCADAEALGWQTPQLGDFAYVIEGDGSADDVISEYVITNVDDDCNLTWAFSHSFNAGQYQEQSSLSMAGMILTGGTIPGTFGTPIDPSTLIRGVMRNGVLLTPDAQGKVNVIVDPAHIIVNALPTTGIVDGAEYVVIDKNLDVTGTWVHDATGWYQTYEKTTAVVSHQVVTALPTTGIETGVEYVVIDNANKVTGTWVYDPAHGWLQTEVLDKSAHIVVTALPTTNIDDEAEYVVVKDLNDPVNTYEATYVHTTKGWVKTSQGTSSAVSHIVVTALPTTNINEDVEYIVMTNVNDPTTITGTWVRVNGNWVQTEKISEGIHFVTALPTTNIDSHHIYIVVGDLANPDTSFIGQFAYDDATHKWVDITAKSSEVHYSINRNGQELASWFGGFVKKTYTVNNSARTEMELMEIDGEQLMLKDNAITLKAGRRYQIAGNLGLESSTGRTQVDNYAVFRDVTNGVDIGIMFMNNTSAYYTGGAVSCQYTVPDGADIQLKVFAYGYGTGTWQVMGADTQHRACITIQEIGRVVDPVAYLDQNGEAEDTPVGTVQAFLGTKAPENYLLCDGSEYAVGQYPALEAFIIENYDDLFFFGGNGTTTWAVPDLRGEFLRGAGENTHTNTATGGTVFKEGAGADVGEHQKSTVHEPNFTYANAGQGGICWEIPALGVSVYPENMDVRVTDTKGRHWNHSMLNSSNTGNGNVGWRGFTSRPTNTSVNFIIKYQKTPVVITSPTIDGESVALKMMTPNTWVAGVEQSFGNGVYGMRMKGTLNVVANVRAQVTVASGASNLLNCGGQWTRQNKTKIAINSLPLQSAGKPVAPWAGVQLNVDNKIMLDINSDTAETGAEYDMWVIYTK